MPAPATPAELEVVVLRLKLQHEAVNMLQSGFSPVQPSKKVIFGIDGVVGPGRTKTRVMKATRF
ncbi:MAG: hypothetical protein ACREC9_10005 [Methylocella sp.]